MLILLQGEHTHTLAKGRLKRVGRNQPTKQMVNLADMQRVFRSQAIELSAMGITIPGKCTHTRRIDEAAERHRRYFIATTASRQVDARAYAFELLAQEPLPEAFGVGTTPYHLVISTLIAR
jgi:hypothetical protein